MFARLSITAALLAACAGTASAQVVIDGQLTDGDNYGPLRWVQSTPTGFGDNIAGTGSTPGNPADVIFGAELAIPLSAIGNPNVANGITLMGMLTGGANVSNQIISGDPLPANSANLGNGRALDFQSDALPGNQYLTIFPQVVSGAPTLDGSLESFWNGRRMWVQSNYTGFGDNSLGQPGQANGSELNNLFAVVSNNDTPGDASDDVLYLFIGGNFNNGNRVSLFFDTEAGGQNRLLNGNVSWGFGFSTDLSASTPDNTDGLRFDAGFEPDYWTWFNVSGTTLYADFLTIPSSPPGTASYVGCTTPEANAGQVGMLGCGGSGNPAGYTIRFNNSNTAGVGGTTGSQTTPDRDIAFGSEIDGVYGKVEGDYLYLLVTGNLENNWNKLCLFFDADPADGQNQLRGDNPDVSFNGLNRMGNAGNGTPGAGLGVKFDDGFFADYFLIFANGNNPVDNYIDTSVLRANGPNLNSGFIVDYSSYDGGAKATNDPIVYRATYADYQDFSLFQLQSDAAPRQVGDWALLQPPPPVLGDPLIPPPEFAGQISGSIDNNNIAGVTDVSVAGAELVTTGIELKIPLSEIGCVGCTEIKVAGFIVNDGFGVVSNQVLGGLGAGAANLNEPTLIDFSQVAGDQFVIIPTVSGPTCDADVNCDGSPDQGDVACMILSVAGDTSCICQDPDFNLDGSADQGDVAALIGVVAGQPCP